MPQVSFLEYLPQAAKKCNFTLPSMGKADFPDFKINDPKASIEEVELVITGNLNVRLSKRYRFIGGPDFPFSQIGLPMLENMMGWKELNHGIDFTIKICPGDTLTIKLIFSVSTFSISFGSKSLEIEKPNITVTVTPGVPCTASFEVQATMPITLYEKQSLDLEANFSFVLKGDALNYAQVGFDNTFKNGVKLPSFLGNNITLNSIGASMGIIFEPPGCLLGFEAKGTLNIPNSNTDITNFGIVCDVEGDVPIPLYIAFGLNRINLAQFLETFASVIPLPKIPIEFTKPAFAYCSKGVTLPDGTSVLPGLSFSSNLSFFGEDMYGKFTYTEDEELKAKFQSKNTIGIPNIITISGNAPAVTRKTGISNSKVPTTIKEWDVIKNTPLKTIFPAGGAEFSLDLSKSSDPEFTVDAKLKFLGTEAGSVTGSLGKNGVSFHATIAELTAATFTLNNGVCSADISFCLPNVEISNDRFVFGEVSPTYAFGASLTIKNLDSGAASLFLTIDTTRITVASNIDLSFAMKFGSIQILLETFMSAVNSKNIIDELIKVPMLWVSAVVNGLLSPEEKSEMTDFVMQGLAGLGLHQNNIANFLTPMIGPLKLVSTKIVQGLTRELDLSPTESADVLFAIHKIIPTVPGFQPKGIANTMRNGYNAPPSLLATIFHSHSVAVNVAALALTGVFPEAVGAYEAGVLMEKAGYSPQNISSDFKKLGGDFEKAAKKAEHALNPKNW